MISVIPTKSGNPLMNLTQNYDFCHSRKKRESTYESTQNYDFCHARESGNPPMNLPKIMISVIPAKAGIHL